MGKRKKSSAIKFPGGKSYLAKRIVAMMPAHKHYVECFAGGLSVMLEKTPVGVSEVAADLDGRLTNFWKVLQHKTLFAEFERQVQAVPFSEAAWNDAGIDLVELPNKHNQVKRAVAFFVYCRQSLAGRMEDFTTLSRTRVRRGMNEQASAWLSAVDGLAAVHERLRRVVVLHKPALDVIKTQDGKDTLFYADPPYEPGTRAEPKVYAHEMTTEQHAELLAVLLKVKGKVLLSGYRCKLYDDMLQGWQRIDIKIPNHASGQKTKKVMTESVWVNYPLPAVLQT